LAHLKNVDWEVLAGTILIEMTRLEADKIQLEQERLKIEERRVAVEEQRLEIERETAAHDRKFFQKNSASIITAVVSLAAIFVSLNQVRVANISKEKELAVAQRQNGQQQAEREREFALQQGQREREWNLEVTKFVSENSKVIYGGSEVQRQRIAKLITIMFPPAISDALFSKLEGPLDTKSSQPWERVRNELRAVSNVHIHATVGNTHGGTVPGAVLTYTDLATGVIQRTTTADNGEADIDLLASKTGSTYRVTVEKDGFFPLTDYGEIIPGHQKLREPLIMINPRQ
jgi:hypothetical protein